MMASPHVSVPSMWPNVHNHKTRLDMSESEGCVSASDDDDELIKREIFYFKHPSSKAEWRKQNTQHTVEATKDLWTCHCYCTIMLLFLAPCFNRLTLLMMSSVINVSLSGNEGWKYTSFGLQAAIIDRTLFFPLQHQKYHKCCCYIVIYFWD